MTGLGVDTTGVGRVGVDVVGVDMVGMDVARSPAMEPPRYRRSGQPPVQGR